MTQDSITEYIVGAFDHVRAASAYGDVFYFYNPVPEEPNEIYFATVKVSDNDFDDASGLDRLGAFRLNIGVSKNTFTRLFGTTEELSRAHGEGKGYDYSAVNVLLPHPLYSGASWICILNPSLATFAEMVAPLLEEAYRRAVWQYENRR